MFFDTSQIFLKEITKEIKNYKGKFTKEIQIHYETDVNELCALGPMGSGEVSEDGVCHHAR